MTSNAFLEVPVSHRNLFTILCFVFRWCSSSGPIVVDAIAYNRNKAWLSLNHQLDLENRISIIRYKWLTRRIKSSPMQETPRAVSYADVWCTCSPMLRHISRKVEPLAGMPRMSFIWDETIIRATADVNPELTGPDTKSIRKPKNLRIEPSWIWK